MTISSRAPSLTTFTMLTIASVLLLAASPKPTPTPEPRLTGGFGKSSRPVEKKKVRITNENLTTEPDKGKLTTSSRPAPTPVPKDGSARGESATSGAEAGRDEDYWRNEARRVRERVADLKETIVRLQNESQKLENDFYSWDDGAYRDRVIKPAWDRTREELATARKELPIAEKDLQELPDRARKAGALPGWIRE